MKKRSLSSLIFIVILSFTTSSLLFSKKAFADDNTTPTLRLHISGTKDNTYFICLNNVGGCVSIEAGAKGSSYPINPGSIDYIATTNTRDFSVNTQSLPDSCKVTVQSNQTLVIKGTLKKAANDNAYIDHLSCSVA
jgi:hypothetical protein